MEWLLPTGLVLYAAGAIWGIAEEWRDRGLTDTSFPSLLLLSVGPALIALWAWSAGRPATALTVLLPTGAFLVMILCKARDRLRMRRWIR
mgnify:CR=1 FL=1